MAVRRRVDKSKHKLDLDMFHLWDGGQRDSMLEVFGDVESAQRFYLQHEARFYRNGPQPSEGWWEMFGPPELRGSEGNVPDWFTDWNDPDYRDRQRDILVRRADWLDEHYPGKWKMREVIERHDAFERWQRENPR
jgi:hypothetical protein